MIEALISIYVFVAAINMVFWANGDIEVDDIVWWPIRFTKYMIKSFWKHVSTW